MARGEVLPTSVVAAIAVGKSGEAGVFPMRWGFRRADGRGLVINTRSETAFSRPAVMPERRCLIPCSWYYEWETRDAQPSLLEDFSEDALPAFQAGESAPAKKRARGQTLRVKYAIRPRASGVMYLAAVYRYEADQKLPALSILTRSPAPEIAFIHDRMPVIFSEQARDAWLDRSADPQAALALCETAMAFQKA